jgi:hypothetical protein
MPIKYLVASGGTDTSDATATAGDILADETAYGAEGKLTGEMPHQSGGVAALSAFAMDGMVGILVPGGYYDGEADSVMATDANLIAANIKEGVEIMTGLVGTLALNARATAGVNLTVPDAPTISVTAEIQA